MGGVFTMRTKVGVNEEVRFNPYLAVFGFLMVGVVSRPSREEDLYLITRGGVNARSDLAFTVEEKTEDGALSREEE